MQYWQIPLLCFCLAACKNLLIENQSVTARSSSLIDGNWGINDTTLKARVFNDKVKPKQSQLTLKATQLLRVGNDEYTAVKLGEDRFDDENWKERWHLESSDASVSIIEGQLRTEVPQGGTGLNFWYKEYNEGELPRDILVRFKAKSIIEGEGWLQIIMLNTNVRWADNSEYRLGMFNGKDGDYQNNLRMYRTSLTRDALVLRATPPRRNLLFENREIVVQPNQQIEVVVAVHNGRIKGYIDRVKMFDLVHSHPKYTMPFEGGKVGIRTNKSKIVWDDFEFYQLLP